MQTSRLELLVSGIVQGVGFRMWVREQARRRNLSGSAENRPDGRVAVIVEGGRAACEGLLAAIGSQSPGRVEHLEVIWAEPFGESGGFLIR